MAVTLVACSAVVTGVKSRPDPVTLAKIIPWFEEPLRFLTNTVQVE
ncbi:hypothetical protein ACFO3J_23725 [Streptomyces polygonati]|uniref:Uncharacterized protein n=1 Tax=Streptomyces polygonati TaxID=1617087 RepID=A0ABV8HR69_9ACTN